MMTERTVEEVQSLIHSGIALAEHFALQVEQLDTRAALVRVPFNPKLLRPGGTLAGPVLMTLADAAMYAAILGASDGEVMALTCQLNINFLCPPAQTDLWARAEVIKAGRRLIYCDVKLWSDGDSALVGHATGSYSLP